MIENNLFKFVEHEKDNITAICLLEEAGMYQGIIYRYGEVKLSEKENSDGTLTMTYDWDMLDSNGLSRDEVYTEDFADLTGVILETILSLTISEKEKGLYVSSDGEDDTITVNLQ